MADSASDPFKIMGQNSDFNLGQRLAQWGDALREREGFSSEQVRELEQHLVDLMDEFMAKGLSPAEAFSVAQQRLGHPDELSAEFLKVNPQSVWRRRVFWMILGILFWLAAPMICISLYRIILWSTHPSLGFGQSMGGPGSAWVLQWTILLIPVGLLYLMSLGKLDGLGRILAKTYRSRAKLALHLVALGLLLATANAFQYWLAVRSFPRHPMFWLDFVLMPTRMVLLAIGAAILAPLPQSSTEQRIAPAS